MAMASESIVVAVSILANVPRRAKSVLTPPEQAALMELKANASITILRADHNGGSGHTGLQGEDAGTPE